MSKEFFECNLPKIAPKYVKGVEKRNKITRILKQVHARMNKLNEALEISGMVGEQFSAGAKILFDQLDSDGNSLLDSFDAQHIADYVGLIANNIKYEKRYEWPNAIVIVDTAFLSTPEWEAVRTIGIGGSDAAVTMGVSPYRTEQALYHDKVGTEMKMDCSKQDKNFIFSFGHKVEPLVIEEFCRRTGAKVVPETRMFAKKGMPFITANIDAIVLLADKIFVFEAKTTTYFNKDAWKDGKVPVQYIPQCRQYPSVLDDPRIAGTYIGCIYGNTPDDWFCQYIERDLQKEAEQLKIESDFWFNYVLSGIEPEESGNPEKDITLFREISGPADNAIPEINLDEDCLDVVNDYLSLKSEKQAIDKKKKGIDERMQQLSLELITQLGNGTKGKLKETDDTYFEIKYTPVSKTSIDTEKLRLKYPDVYADTMVFNPENSRRFSISHKKEKKQKKAS